MLPSGLVSTSISPQHLLKLKLTWVRSSAGSSTLVDSPPCRPAFNVPPLTGPAAITALAIIELATVAVTPSAAARPRKSRRVSRPAATRWLRYSSSFDMDAPHSGIVVFVGFLAAILTGNHVRKQARIRHRL